ncbi:MAG: short-subunit dehydrogenase [Lentisphaeria bacterium]|jgi:short-subunit dehydrogenase
MKNKPILITGCSTGIGYHAAITLQQRGYCVLATVRKAEDVKRLKQAGLKYVFELDLRSSESIERGLKQALSVTDGKLYALFNNGAYGQPGAVEDLPRSALLEQFETNVFGTHELTTKVIPHLLTQASARIIQNSSILGFAAMPMRGAYNASKFALEGLTDTLRMELSETNIKVSIIEPGPILSSFRQNAIIALKENIDISASRHQSLYQGVLDRLSKKGPSSKFTLPPEAVVNKLIHALESKWPKQRYYVTVPTYLLAYLRHFLPTSVMDALVIKIAKSEG